MPLSISQLKGAQPTSSSSSGVNCVPTSSSQFKDVALPTTVPGLPTFTTSATLPTAVLSSKQIVPTNVSYGDGLPMPTLNPTPVPNCPTSPTSALPMPMRNYLPPTLLQVSCVAEWLYSKKTLHDRGLPTSDSCLEKETSVGPTTSTQVTNSTNSNISNVGINLESLGPLETPAVLHVHPDPIPPTKLWDHLVSLSKQSRPSFKRKNEDSALLSKFAAMSLKTKAPSLTDQLKKLKLNDQATSPEDPMPAPVLLATAAHGNEKVPCQVQNGPTDVSDGGPTTLSASASF